MQGKDKHRNIALSDFLRYHGDEMKDQERNAFERSLQQDPFAEEASDGYAKTSPALAEKDMSELRKRLKRKIPVNRKDIWYRMAASVAAVMILASVFIFNREEKPEEQFARTPESPVIKESQVKSEPEPVVPGVKDQVAVSSYKRVQSQSGEPERISFTKVEPVMEEVPAENRDDVAIAEAMEAEPILLTEKAPTLPLSGIAGNNNPSVPVRGKIISSDDRQPLPGASVTVKGTNLGAITDTGGNFSLNVYKANEKVFVANFIGMEPKEFKAEDDSNLEIRLDPSVQSLSEMVVVGYGVKKSRPERTEGSEGFSPPQPVNGQADFDRYIRDNIRRPDSTSTGQRAVVVLTFTVGKTGKPDSIKVVRSPGRTFSDEAIRLLREGPSWKPAEENGVIISDEVRIRIVFK